MHELHELRDMLMNELQNVTDKGELNAGMLDTVNKITHSIKSIDTILAMQGSGYSNGYSYTNRDDRGRYSRTGNRYSRRYSRTGSDLVDELRELMNETTDARSRKAIQNAIHEME